MCREIRIGYLGAGMAAIALTLTALPVGAIDYAWRNPVDGNASVPTNWNPTGTPDSTSLVTLPAFSNQSYTVNHDVAWTINDLKAYGYSTAHLNGFGLTVNLGGDFYDYSTLKITNATYNPTGTVALRDHAVLRLVNGTLAGAVNTGATTSILGYGTINDNLASNDGLIQAENGQLTIGLVSDSHNSGTLSALSGATLYIRNAADIKNGDTVSPAGGTIKGYQYAVFTLLNGTSSAGRLISGRGTIDRYYIRNTGSGGDAGTIRPTGGILTLNYGFRDGQNSGIIELQPGGTLSVPNNTWINYNTITMTGGGIAGQTMSQNATLNITGSAANTIQNVTFNAGATISNGATLTITGTGTLNGATIAESGAGGYFNVGSGAVVQGRGTINPDMTDAGTLAANVSGATLALNGTLNIQSGRAAYAGGGGTLDLNGTVTNSGSLYAASGAVTVDGAITNGGSVYATGSGSVLTCSSAVYNRMNMYAVSSGSLTVSGTIKAGTLETGDFYATSAAMNLGSATVESDVRNTFTANSGGTITLWSNPSTAGLYLAEALKPRGGTITLASGQTMTNAAGKTVKGYGTLLASGCNLSNANGATIEADGGTLTVNGSVANAGTMKADGSGNTLTLTGPLTTYGGSSTEAANGAVLNLNGTVANGAGVTANSATVNIAGSLAAMPTATGDFSAAGSGAQMLISGMIAPGVRNTFTAGVGGTVALPGSLSTGDLYQAEALRPRGGTLTLQGGTTLTNAAGKTIRGYGTLLGGLLTLANESGGVVEADAGVLTIPSSVTNRGILRAIGGGDQLIVSAALSVQAGGQVFADLGGGVSLTGALVNDGSIATGLGGGTVLVGAVAPTGSGVFLCGGGAMRFADGFSNAGLSRVDALQLAGGNMTVTGGGMTNAAGKRISGYGWLLDPGHALTNAGELRAQGGKLSVRADLVKNTGMMSAAAADSLHVSGILDNTVAGIVRSADGAAVVLGEVRNKGRVEILNGGGTGSIVFNGSVIGGGTAAVGATYFLHEGRMVFGQGVTMIGTEKIDDDHTPGSTIEVNGNLTKREDRTGFDADHVRFRLYTQSTVPITLAVDWHAEDRGAIVQGLDGNLAMGHLTFGDGVGGPRSDRFALTPETTIYCYGITIESDADVDLGGRTIYYLPVGLAHNGILGTGFENRGSYTNGEILPIEGGTADFDTDGDVDLADFAFFQACFNGPNQPYAGPQCEPADFDSDLDIDLADFAVFQGCFNGPNRPTACE